MAMTTMTETHGAVTGGVDTHRDFHVAAVLDARGAELGCDTFPTTAAGYRQLHGWLASFGDIDRVGVEGTGSYGKGLARHLQGEDVTVIEVDRPNRQVRRRHGKSDTVDAVAAARAAQCGDATAVAKTADGITEQLRVLRIARRSANADRIEALAQLRAIVVTAPDDLRQQLTGLTAIGLCKTAAAFRVPDPLDARGTIKWAMRNLARRAETLRADIKEMDRMITTLVRQAAPELLNEYGVGPDCASTLLVTAGSNPHRIHSQAAFAKLCGTAPIEASSGEHTRHRLSRTGDRQANAALYRVAMVRLRYEPRTQAYRDQLAAAQKTNKEILRCLKRAIAREIYQAIKTDFHISHEPSSHP